MSWGRINHPSEIVQVGRKNQSRRAQVRCRKGTYFAGHETAHARSLAYRGGKISDRHARAGQGDQHHGLRRFRRAGKRHRRVDAISEMSWTRKVAHPSKILQVGQQVEVVVLNVDPGHRRISLGLKQVMANPWEAAKEKYPVGSVVKGPVRNITDFGIFVGIEEGIDGLVHISDLHWTKKVKHPSELYKKGDIVEAKVLGRQRRKRAILSRHQATGPGSVESRRRPHPGRVEDKGTGHERARISACSCASTKGVEGLIHVSQLSTERVDKPSSLI